MLVAPRICSSTSFELRQASFQKSWFLGETPNDIYYQLAITNGFVTTDLSPGNVDNNFDTSITIRGVAVPEPTSAGLLALGLVGFTAR